MILDHYTHNGVQHYNGRPVNQMATTPGTAPHAIMRKLDRPMTAHELAEATGFAVRHLRSTLYRMMGKGCIIKTGTGAGATYSKREGQ